MSSSIHLKNIRNLIIVLLMICIFSSNAPVVTASGSLESNSSQADEVINTTYLPQIRYEYNWQLISEWKPWALQDRIIFKLYFDSSAEILWSVTYDGLFRSSNLGRSWSRVDVDGQAIPHALAINRDTNTNSLIYAAVQNRVYVSSDHGATWALDGEFYPYVNHLEFVGNVPYAVSANPLQVHRRVSTGMWEPIGGELTDGINDLEIFNSALYAATYSGLFRLSGNSWEPVSTYPFDQPANVKESFPYSSHEQTLLLSDEVTATQLPVRSIIVIEGTMYIGTQGGRGIYKSNDGINWTACDVGITGAYGPTINQLIFSNNHRLYAATTDGVFVSDNFGDRWQALDQGLPHSTTTYGVLLDRVSANVLVLLRDKTGEETLAAVFNQNGIWLLTLTEEMMLKDLTASVPPKALLVVGPIDPPDHAGTRDVIRWADRLASIMVRNGMEVVKIYWPYSTWENVRAALSGASILVYKGHGFGVGDLSNDPTEMHGGVNGFTLVHPLDPMGAILGTQDMLVATNRLTSNAIAFFYCCYCAGSSSSDSSPVSLDLARRRIEAYSSTVIRMGGRGYFSGLNEEGILERMFRDPDKKIGDIYKEIEGGPEYAYNHILWPEIDVWFSNHSDGGWEKAFVGDPDLTLQEILNP